VPINDSINKVEQANGPTIEIKRVISFCDYFVLKKKPTHKFQQEHQESLVEYNIDRI
jgi:hypothetical protein